MTAPLVFPYVASFKVLDNTGQTQNEARREPVTRTELADAVELSAQVRPDDLGTLAMWAAGRDLEQTVKVFAHRRDLARRSLMDATTGMPTTPKVGDRLEAVLDFAGDTVVTVADPPGAYVEGVVPCSFGPGRINALYEIRLSPRRARR
jgi:hypothetical protein